MSSTCGAQFAGSRVPSRAFRPAITSGLRNSESPVHTAGLGGSSAAEFVGDAVGVDSGARLEVSVSEPPRGCLGDQHRLGERPSLGEEAHHQLIEVGWTLERHDV